jgi:hypothetical protein
MARLIPAAERITRPRALIQKAYEHPVPAVDGNIFTIIWLHMCYQ